MKLHCWPSPLSDLKVYLIVILLAAVFIGGLKAEVVDVKVAVLSSHEPRDISYYTELRRRLYEASSLRGLRFVNRQTGLVLDEGHWFRSIASALLVLASTLIFIGFFKRRWRRVLYYSASTVLIIFVSWIFLFSGVASLNQADMKGGHRVQDILDVTTAWGIGTEVFWDWNQFTDTWEKEERQPHVVVAWMGLPLGAEELEIESWLSEHRHLSMLHLCIGANLPKMFHRPLFGDKVPTLDWAPGSPRSITEAGAAYGREVSWQIPDAHSTSAQLVPWGKHWILYLPTSLEPSSTARLLEKGMEALDDLIWGRLDMSKVIALRLDDPGSSINLHLEPWRFQTLPPERWEGIATELKNLQGSMTVGICPGWVDDGDESRGAVKVSGQMITQRKAGTIFPTHKVIYTPSDGSKPWRYDLQAKALKTNSIFDLQSHGHTHVSPNLEAWATSERRYEDADWYREFLVTEHRPFQQRPIEVQKSILLKSIAGYRDMMGHDPSVLIPPGHAISWNTAYLAFEAGFEAMAGRHLVLRQGKDLVRRTRLIPAVDINELNKLSDAPYPAMILLHDRDFSDPAKKLTPMLEPLIKQGRDKFTNVNHLVHSLKSAPELKIDRIQNTLLLEWPSSSNLINPLQSNNPPIHFQIQLPSDVNIQWEKLNSIPGIIGVKSKGRQHVISYQLHDQARSVSLPFSR